MAEPGRDLLKATLECDARHTAELLAAIYNAPRLAAGYKGKLICADDFLKPKEAKEELIKLPLRMLLKGWNPQ